MPRPKSYDTKAAAKYMGICTDTLTDLAKCGLIVRYKVGGCWRYDETDLDDYRIQQHHEGYAEAARLRDKKSGKRRPAIYRKPTTIDDIRRTFDDIDKADNAV